MAEKTKFAFYLTAEKKQKLERRYHEDGSRSMTAFVENAVDFYLDYLSASDAGAFLPTAIKSVIDGRLGMLEDRMASLLYKQSVEIDMTNGIIAHNYEIGEETMRHMRSQSVRNVKETNGRISFEQRMREAGDE